MENIKEKLELLALGKYNNDIENLSVKELYDIVGTYVISQISQEWRKSNLAHYSSRRACYFSAEYLIGKPVYKNLLCLGIEEEIEDVLNSYERSIKEFESLPDELLGNGGLGRLAACFLDSAANLGVALDGYGIRYRFGLFKQTIENGFQIEKIEDSIEYNDPWCVPCREDKVKIHFADGDVLAVPFDMPVISFKTQKFSNLRLWQSESVNEFDFKLFNELYGEECGDRILKWCGHIIENTVGSKGETFRFGSNEYVVLINSDEKKKVALIAAKIQKNFLLADEEKPDVLQPVTASVGIAFYPDTASGADELLSQAERANFYAKRDGKNCIKIYGAHTEDELEDQQVQKHYEQIAPTIYALTAAIDAKDSYTFEHSCHVSDYAVLLAKKIGLEPNDIEIAKEAGLLHDIGKIGIPESILKKQGRLNDEEYEIMKTHVTNSIEMIHFLPNMNYVIPAVLSHHERYDGKGYPRGLKGEDIPLLGRILAVCDSFDAMTTKRTYKEAMSIDYAISELEHNKGTQFDPKLAEAFIELLKEGKIEV